MTTVNAKFKELLKQSRKLDEMGDSFEYYKERDHFNHELNKFISQNNWASLSSLNILSLCSLVSVYRPMAPHSFLMRCSQLVVETKTLKSKIK